MSGDGRFISNLHALGENSEGYISHSLPAPDVEVTPPHASPSSGAHDHDGLSVQVPASEDDDYIILLVSYNLYELL